MKESRRNAKARGEKKRALAQKYDHSSQLKSLNRLSLLSFQAIS
jgi:hypothetical protein